MDNNHEIRLASAQPVFLVGDLNAAVAFYCDELDFSLAWSWGEPVVRAGVQRDELQLQLIDNPTIGPSGTSCVYCVMSGVDRFYRACVNRGVEIYLELGEREWGMKDFRIVDPSGNRLGFGEVSS